MSSTASKNRKHYAQFCPMATALDIVGDRWTMLILRELLGGPARFHELQAGLPGIAVPAGKDSQGLPLGLQLIGRPFDEETLFSLGEVIEQAAGRFTPAKWW